MTRLLLLALLASDRPRILAVRMETVGAQQALRVAASGDLADVTVRREGAEVVVSLKAEASARLVPPPALPPIEAVRIEERASGVALRIRVRTELPYEVRREGSLLTVLFGAGLAGASGPTRTASLAELYKRVFPTPSSEPTDSTSEQRVGATAPEVSNAPPESEESLEGLTVGLMTLRPSASLSYVDAEVAPFETAQPARDQYFQIEPRIAVQRPLGMGTLRGDYELRLREASSFGLVEGPSHLANASLEMPVGVRLLLRVSDHFTRGLLEAQEVDPGREYFFRLGRFRRNQVVSAARMDLLGRTALELGGGIDKVRFDGPSGFFGYERREGRVGLALEVSPRLSFGLAYVYEWVPPPQDRPEAESRSQAVQISLNSEVLPLLRGHFVLGYRDQKNPRAAAGGQHYQGLTAEGRLTREFSRASSLVLSGSHSTHLSAFEGNAFYVTTSAQGELTLPLPFSFSWRGAAGHQWNEYRTLAARLGEPREDRILGWSLGLGRPLGRWAFLRADYRRERRRSNLSLVENETEAFLVQVGIGLFGVSPRP